MTQRLLRLAGSHRRSRSRGCLRLPAKLATLVCLLALPGLAAAVLFAGIFVTMVLALALLRGSAFSLSEPWQYFWLTGALSSFLDNARRRT